MIYDMITLFDEDDYFEKAARLGMDAMMFNNCIMRC